MKKFFICALTVFSLIFSGCSDLFTARDEVCSVQIDADAIMRAVNANMKAGGAETFSLVVEAYEYKINESGDSLVKDHDVCLYREEKNLSLSKNKTLSFEPTGIKKGMYVCFDLYIKDSEGKFYFTFINDESFDIYLEGNVTVELGNGVYYFDKLNKDITLNFDLSGGNTTKIIKSSDDLFYTSGCQYSVYLLNNNIELTSFFEIPRDMTIDLNGHTITLAATNSISGSVFKSENKNLTIKNGTIDCANLSQDAYLIHSSTTSDAAKHNLNLSNIVFKGTGSPLSGSPSTLIYSSGCTPASGGTSIASDCTITNCKFENIDLTGNTTGNYVVHQSNYGKLRIKDTVFNKCYASASVIGGDGNDTLLDNVLIKDCKGSSAGAVFQGQEGCTVLAGNTVIQSCFVNDSALNVDEAVHVAIAIQTNGEVVVCGAQVLALPTIGDAKGKKIATVVVGNGGTFRVTDSYTKNDNGEIEYERSSKNFNKITALNKEGVTSYSIINYGRILLGGTAVIDGVMRFEKTKDAEGLLMMISETQPQNLKVSVNKATETTDGLGTWNTPFGEPGPSEKLTIYNPVYYKNYYIDKNVFTTNPTDAHWEEIPYNTKCPKIIYTMN